MSIDTNIESSNDELNTDENESYVEIENNITEFELYLASDERKRNKHANRRNYDAMRKIEQLKEERQLRKLDEDYYDDWD